MVLLTLKPSFLEASCWRVEVVNGGAGDFFAGFLSIDEILKFALIFFSKNETASSFDLKFPNSWAENLFSVLLANLATTLNDETGTKLFISASRSTNNLTATD